MVENSLESQWAIDKIRELCFPPPRLDFIQGVRKIAKLSRYGKALCGLIDRISENGFTALAISEGRSWWDKLDRAGRDRH